MALLKIALTPAQMVFAAGAIHESVNGLRKFLTETDHKFGEHNAIQRQALRERKGAHAEMMVVLRTAGYPMTNSDIEDLPIDHAPLEKA